jgi:Fe-S-cluster-containing dehydrogenase component
LRLIGETACLNNYPYGTTVTAIEESFVLEIRRNVLLQMLRVPETRERLNEFFRQDALEPYLLRLPLFSVLGVSDRQRLSRQVASQIRFVRADPGQIICAQGGPAYCCYLVRVGFVRVSQEQAGQEVVLDYVGPGGFFGDEELMESTDGPPPRCASSCRALDHVELIEVPRQAIVQVLNDPQVRDRLRSVAESRQRRYELQMARTERPLESYLDQGLYHARSLLVLDLDKCTRCDECTKACADTHNGVTRLIREGLRFENFLVATSCRSCLDPTCLIGCPVDAIHRRKRREISIEAWCIGCGLCARSCPYGNIHMTPFADGKRAEPAFKATTCDLCQDLSPQADPSCVYACPHDAAHRKNGRELLKEVEAKRARKEV